MLGRFTALSGRIFATVVMLWPSSGARRCLCLHLSVVSHRVAAVFKSYPEQSSRTCICFIAAYKPADSNMRRLCLKICSLQNVALSPKHKFGLTPSQLSDFEKGEGQTIPAGGAFNRDPDLPDVLSEQARRAGRHRRRNHVPWASLVGFLLCAVFLVAGMQLLFGAKATQDGAK